MDADEKKKIKELLRNKDKSEEKLQWMYKGDKPETDEYLLGKRIDRHIEQDDKPPDDVGALFAERIQANIAMDMASKAREDPLFAIRKKEEDVKRKLLENPVKMKRLQKQLEDKRKKSTAKHDGDSDDDLVSQYLKILNQKQKSSGHKKKKKHRSKRSDDDSDDEGSSKYDKKQKHKHSKDQDYSNKKHRRDSESDEQNIRRKHRHDYDYDNENRSRKKNVSDHEKIRKSHNGGNKHDSFSDDMYQNRKVKQRHGSPHGDDCQKRKQRPDSSSEDEYRSKHKHHSHENVSKHRNKHDYKKHHTDREDSQVYKDKNSRHKHKEVRRDESDDKQPVKTRHDSDSEDEQPIRTRHDSDSEDEQPIRSRHYSDSDEERKIPVPRKYGLIKLKQTSDDDHPKRKRSRSPKRQRSRSPVTKPKPTYNKADFRPKKLTEEEKQKRLEEMMDNAKWREENRTKNVKRYKEEDKQEVEERSKSRSSDFINSMMSSHADQSSVEDRIKRNRYNLQRTKVDLDKNFLKK